MNWALTLVIAVITSLASAATAGYLGSLCVSWFRMNSRDGGEAWFVYYLAIAGLIAGFLLGLFTARLIHSGFWLAQAYSLAISLGICLVIGLAIKLLGDFPPTRDGKLLELEVELRSSLAWQPGQEPNIRSWCWLQPLGPAGIRRTTTSGTIETREREPNGPLTLGCNVSLLSSRPTRLVRISYSDLTDVTFSLPSSGPADMQWSPWTKQGLVNTVNPNGYEVRYRIRPKGMLWQEQQDEAAARVSDSSGR